MHDPCASEYSDDTSVDNSNDYSEEDYELNTEKLFWKLYILLIRSEMNKLYKDHLFTSTLTVQFHCI